MFEKKDRCFGRLQSQSCLQANHGASIKISVSGKICGGAARQHRIGKSRVLNERLAGMMNMIQQQQQQQHKETT